MRFMRMLLLLALLVTLLLIAAVAYAIPLLGDDEPPTVPHPIPSRLDCLGCHAASEDYAEKHQGQTNETCPLCHTPRDVTGIPLIAHPIQGQEKCLDCHAAGKVKPYPADHRYQANEVCTVCHHQGATTGATTPAAGAIPPVPHSTQGREDCVACHGAGQIKPFPADHAGRTSDTCLGCHQVQATAATAVPAAGAIPPVPHATEGRENCLACHDTGGVRPFPADHAGRTSDTCLGCHQVQATAATAAPAAAAIPAVPHATEGRENCLACHDTGGVKPFPADHAGRTSDTCLGCHQAGAAPTPAPPSVHVVPTPIQEPALFAENSCVTCHEGLGGKSCPDHGRLEAGGPRRTGCGLCELPRRRSQPGGRGGRHVATGGVSWSAGQEARFLACAARATLGWT